LRYGLAGWALRVQFLDLLPCVSDARGDLHLRIDGAGESRSSRRDSSSASWKPGMRSQAEARSQATACAEPLPEGFLR
jgi:hypothetical protein